MRIGQWTGNGNKIKIRRVRSRWKGRWRQVGEEEGARYKVNLSSEL